jgi:N-acyl-D-aspartate/D-glutamate deacylase
VYSNCDSNCYTLSPFILPGFVDSHSHDDLALLSDPLREVKRRQGIVHQVIGNCGLTPFPLRSGDHPEYEKFLYSVLGECPRRDGGLFVSPADFLTSLPKNVTALAGYNTIREHLFGAISRPLDADELRKARGLIDEALEAGAKGVSIGLAYRPALEADRDELVALAQSTPLLTVHMRNESNALLQAIDEIAGAVRDARRGGASCHLHISHLKIAGEANWGLKDRLLKSIARWRNEIGITFDHYPFNFGSTGLAALLPPEFSSLPHDKLARVPASAIEARLGETDWENYVDFAGPANLVLVNLTFWPHLNGTTLEGQDLGELIRDLVLSEPNPSVLIRGQSDAVIDELLKLPYGCIGSDALPDVGEHPRLTSTFPVYLERMKALGLSLDFAIEKAARLPRRIFGIESARTVRIDPASWEIKGDSV